MLFEIRRSEGIHLSQVTTIVMGSRPKRSAQDAIRRVHELLCAGYTDVVDADLSKYTIKFRTGN